ncbi:MAG TPA: menaquinone biosynthesis protein [Terracidiphilus sp.]|nr:menaquinone biosynthesis protein [Terracidiphilus sp.]
MAPSKQTRLRIAAIRFLNPAPLMWDFEHSPAREELASRYQLDWMLPSQCADRIAGGAADIGLVPIASLPLIPGIGILPGCTIASKDCVRSLLLVRRAHQPLAEIRTVAADTASRTTIAYTRLLFRMWGNPAAEFVPMPADLDAMLARADAAIVIGDPALLALEERANRTERSEVELAYHDLAHEWRALTGLPFVSAVWGAVIGAAEEERVAQDFIRSRDHGLANIELIAEEWSRKMPLPESTIRRYLSENIHYVLDDECIAGMRGFFRMAAEAGILPRYEPSI